MLITLMYILIGLLGIGFAIFIHELGHFITARLFHVDVEVLSYGFGPRLLSIFSRGTEYRLSAIPLGGYCRMKGSEDIRKALANDEKNISSAEPGSIYSIRPSGRFMIYAAGPAASFIAAALFLAVLSLIVPLFVSAFQRAEDLANAMEARGYAPGEKRTRYKVLHLATRDYLLVVGALVLFGVILFISYGL